MSTKDQDNVLLTGTAKPKRLLVGVEDAALMLGIGQRTLWQKTKDGELLTVRIGKRTLWPVSELESWVNEQIQQTTVKS